MAKKEAVLSAAVCPEGMSLAQWQVQLRTQAARKGAFAVADLPDKKDRKSVV